MKNNKIGAVSIESTGRKKTKIPLTHDVNTSCGFTEVHPLQCVLLPAKTKSVVRTESLIRLDPMVAPTFGRLDYKVWHYFVNMTDLSRNFSQLMTQKRVSRGNGIEFMPMQVPHAKLGLISTLPLIDSHCTMWISDSYVGQKSHVWELLSSRASADAYINSLVDTYFKKSLRLSPRADFDNYMSGILLRIYAFNPSALVSPKNHQLFGGNDVYGFDIPLNNVTTVSALTTPLTLQNTPSLFDWRDPSDVPTYDYGGVDQTPVQLRSADYVIVDEKTVTISGTVKTYKVAFAFRLSDFGKRLRKILLGLGYQMNVRSLKDVSLMPLFAFFKAYYSTFGILAYTNWEDTACAKLLSLYDNTNRGDFTTAFAMYGPPSTTPYWDVDIDIPMGKYWWQFVKDLSFAYTTDAQDWVSSHTRSFAVAESPLGGAAAPYLDGTIPDVSNQSGVIVEGQKQSPQRNPSGTDVNDNSIPNNHSYINNVIHGQLDSEVLKAMYLQTNIQTIAGQRVAELLRLLGYGDWMDAQNVRFIGTHTVNLNIKDVTSSSDTLKVGADGVTHEGGQGLGSWGANGLGYSKSRAFKYENDEIGFWVTLCAVVPSSGYCQAVLPSLECIDKSTFYDPLFDGKGYEATTKDKVCGSLEWADMSSNNRNDPLSETFGFTPRYSGLKVHPNVANGDFSLRSLRTSLLPYFFDKFIELGERDFNAPVTTGSGATLKTQVQDMEVFEPEELPIAGDIWRFTARYQWLNKLSRIFAVVGDPYAKLNLHQIWGWVDNIDFRKFYEFMSENVDGFKAQNIIYFDAYAPMLQIGDSYETLKDGNEGHPSTAIGKA